MKEIGDAKVPDSRRSVETRVKRCTGILEREAVFEENCGRHVAGLLEKSIVEPLNGAQKAFCGGFQTAGSLGRDPTWGACLRPHVPHLTDPRGQTSKGCGFNWIQRFF